MKYLGHGQIGLLDRVIKFISPVFFKQTYLDLLLHSVIKIGSVYNIVMSIRKYTFLYFHNFTLFTFIIIGLMSCRKILLIAIVSVFF